MVKVLHPFVWLSASLTLAVFSVNLHGTAQSPKSSAGGLTLEATLKLVQDKMNAQGPIQYVLYSRSDPRATEEHLSDDVRSQTSFVTDPATCNIKFQDSYVSNSAISVPGIPNTPHSRVSNRKLSLKSDVNTVLTTESVFVTDGAHELVFAKMMQRHPYILYRAAPSFFVVQVKETDLLTQEFFLHDEADAHVVAEALQNVISLCNHNGKDLF